MRVRCGRRAGGLRGEVVPENWGATGVTRNGNGVGECRVRHDVLES